MDSFERKLTLRQLCLNVDSNRYNYFGSIKLYTSTDVAERMIAINRRSIEKHTDKIGPFGINVTGVDKCLGKIDRSSSVWKNKLSN